MDIFGGIVAGVNLVTGREHGGDVLHRIHNGMAQLKLIGRLLGSDGKVDGVQAVDAVVALRFFLHACGCHQLIEVEKLAISGGYGYFSRVEATGVALGHQSKAYPLHTAIGHIDVVSTQKLFLIVALHSPADVGEGYTEQTQLFAVVLQSPFHRGGSAQFYFIDTGEARQLRLDMLFGVLLYQDGRGGGIQREGHKGAGCLLVGHFHPDDGVAHTVGKLRPRLPDDGGGLETHGIQVGMLVQFYGDAAEAIARGGVELLHTADAGQHGFEFAGHLHLYHAR